MPRASLKRVKTNAYELNGEGGRAKFIATIHQVSNVRSSQPMTIAAYNGFKIYL